MSSEEQKRILKMVEEGKISAEEAMHLIRVIEESSTEGETEVSEPVTRDRSGGDANRGLAANAEKARNFWMTPLWVGVGMTILGGSFMFLAMQASGLGFWFYCAWLPFLLGVAIVALSMASRTAGWLFVRVDQKPGARPQKIVFGFPIPSRLTAWVLRNFGHKIRDLDNTL